MAMDLILRRVRSVAWPAAGAHLLVAAGLLAASCIGLAQTVPPVSSYAASSPPVKSTASAPAKKSIPAPKDANSKANVAKKGKALPVQHRTHHTVVKPAVQQVATAPLPPPPPPPDWPVNDKPRPASVSWNGRDLSIAATNASLNDILNEVSRDTGVKVEGAESDQRIFGSYGPASAREVLSQLLDGSGYNVLIVGDKGEGTPRELVLSARTHMAAASSGSNAQSKAGSDDDAPEEQEQPEQPTNVIQHRPFGLQPGQGRTPEQLQEEQQQRQEQLQQQLLQQQQQQQQPQYPPPK